MSPTEPPTRISDPSVSTMHAKLQRRDTIWILTDLGSTNGTYLNQSRVSRPTPIAAGDQLSIGKTVVEVRR
jgi:pSer/pThr/pTyr-binding forkhead associated (FHA) protein